MLQHYVLDDRFDPVPCPDLLVWARWFETANRVLAKDQDEGRDGTHIEVSTVFLGLDHNFSGTGPPVLWETLVFGGPLDGEGGRYTTKAAALQGHQAYCAKVRAAIGGR